MRIKKEYTPQTMWSEIRKNRKGAFKNTDGGFSTHLMRHEQLGDGSWVVFPSLFQENSGEWLDMSSQANDDWKPVYEEAKKRGEVYNFGEDKESAKELALGEWKEQEPQTVTGVKEYIPQTKRKDQEEYVPQTKRKDQEEYVPQTKREQEEYVPQTVLNKKKK